MKLRRGGCKRSRSAIPKCLVSWGSQVECVSALACLERAPPSTKGDAALAFDRLAELAEGWHEIEPSEIVA